MSKNNNNPNHDFLFKSIEKLHEKVDKMNEKIHHIDKTMEVNTASLVEHVKRTDLLEAEVKKEASKTKHLEEDVKKVKTVYKFLAWCAGAVSFILGIAKILIK